MPKINTNSSGGVIRWDSADWLHGLIPYESSSLGSTSRALTGATGLSFSTGIDPFRSPGYLIPGVEPVDVTNVSTIDNTLSSGIAAGAKAYTLGGTKLHELTISSNTVTNTGSWPHAITSAVNTDDLVLYNVGTTQYLFYSYSKASTGDVGRYDLNVTFADTYLSATAASGQALATTNPHPMIIKADLLYIADGNNLHMFDGQAGANGTMYPNKLVLPTGSVITAFSKTDLYIVIYTYRAQAGSNRTECIAYFWNGVDADPTYKVPIAANQVTAAFSSFLGTIGCFATGQPGVITAAAQQNKIMLYENGIFVTKHYIDATPVYGGVEISGDVVFWCANGELFSYGSPYISKFPAAYNRITKSLLGSTTGMLKNFTGSSFYMSTGSGTAGGLQRAGGSSAGYCISGGFAVPHVTPPFPTERKARVKQVKIQWGAVAGSGNALALYLNTNKGATTKQILSGKTTVTADGLIQQIFSDINGVSLGSLTFDSISFEGTYSSGSSSSNVPPYLQAIEIYYNYIRA